MRWYPVLFWLLWAGVPAAGVAYRYRSWSRAVVIAGATFLFPLAVAFTLLLAGTPAPADLEAWETFSVDVGAPTGYVLAVALTLALFRHRDRARRPAPEPRTDPFHTGDAEAPI